MDLNSFLADSTTGGSWADEMDELPTGPSAGPTFGEGPGLGGSHLTRGMGQGDRYGPRSGGPGGFGDRDDGRPPRAEVPFPTAPPYTAFVGNLSFETTEADLEDFFTDLSVKSVRLVTGMDGKPRGFGYVEFETADNLSQALGASGHDLGGRVVRISVAEAQTSRMGRADEASTWERTGPLPGLPGRSGGFGGMSRDRGPPRDGPGGFEEIERDAPIRGGKFTPSAPSEPRRGFSGYGAPAGGPGGEGGRPPRSFEPAPEIERDAPIRGGKFIPSAPPAERGERRQMFADRERTGPGADEAQTWERRGPLPGQERKGFGGGFGSRTPSDPPMTRRPLQLSARSATGTPGASPPSSTSSTPAGSSSRASPFGAAKPIDTASKEREVEEKLAARPAPTLPEKKERKEGFAGAGEKSEGAWVRKGPLAPAAAKPKDVAPPLPPVEKDTPPHAAAPAQQAAKIEKPAMRKEGFSYSNVAGKSEGGEVEEVTKGVEAL
ncbi:hypothetical protein NBRC10513_005477 [Rhodotorula toruloides]